jgi:hypothetical protein
MSGTWYPSLHDQLATERLASDGQLDDDLDHEHRLLELAADGDVDALVALRNQLTPIDYDELGWAD